jgi:tRNA pseudouridine55 synthase
VRDGILLVDKPGGATSADVVRVIKRRHRIESIGHLGTLDPMATGLLPLCLGAGTKIAQFLAAESKAYTGTIQLGVRTDTADVTGQELERAPVPGFDGARLSSAAASLSGPQIQLPPMYSAVKVGGRELYKHARAGAVVERTPREVTIESFELERIADDRLAFSVACTKGTYVRVLAEDVGRALGTVATLASLRRTRFGPFGIEAATPLTDLEAPESELPLIGVLLALRDVRHLAVDEPTAFAIAAGQRGGLRRLSPPVAGETFGAVVAPDGNLLAVVAHEGGSWRLRRVLMPEAVQLYRP